LGGYLLKVAKTSTDENRKSVRARKQRAKKIPKDTSRVGVVEETARGKSFEGGVSETFSTHRGAGEEGEIRNNKRTEKGPEYNQTSPVSSSTLDLKTR